MSGQGNCVATPDPGFRISSLPLRFGRAGEPRRTKKSPAAGSGLDNRIRRRGLLCATRPNQFSVESSNKRVRCCPPKGGAADPGSAVRSGNGLRRTVISGFRDLPCASMGLSPNSKPRSRPRSPHGTSGTCSGACFAQRARNPSCRKTVPAVNGLLCDAVRTNRVHPFAAPPARPFFFHRSASLHT